MPIQVTLLYMHASNSDKDSPKRWQVVAAVRDAAGAAVLRVEVGSDPAAALDWALLAASRPMDFHRERQALLGAMFCGLAVAAWVIHSALAARRRGQLGPTSTGEPEGPGPGTGTHQAAGLGHTGHGGLPGTVVTVGPRRGGLGKSRTD